MKKFLQICIPIVALLALLAGGAWFFGIYRPDLTANFLLSQAEHAVERGSFQAAERFCRWSRKLTGNSVEASIQMAQSYTEIGNYTKAEYTLVRAIAANPECADLYVALSRTYLAQDKLLDAQEMLDRISNSHAKAEIDAIRPAAPVLSPDSGAYHEYITVSLTCDSGTTTYLTTDGAYPSIASDAYTEPVELTESEYTVRAIAVDANGLVSPLTLHGYKIGNIVEEVFLQDEAIEAAVRELLDFSEDRTILTSDLWSISRFTLPEEAASYDDLAYFTGLQELTIHDVANLDCSFLMNMPLLTYLDLSGCAMTSANLVCIASLTQLQELSLANCSISNVDVLSGMENLQILDLSGNSISSVRAISTNAALIQLSLPDNNLVDVAELAFLSELESLNISNNRLTDISTLSHCEKLWSLNISGGAISDLTSLGKLANLRELFAADNRISDASVLSGCTALQTLDLSGNAISDIAFTALLPALETLNVDENEITTIPAYPTDMPLHRFSAAHNEIRSVEGLSNLMELNIVTIDYNRVKDITVLSTCYSLVRVNAFANPITEVAVLTDVGVIVDFDPTYAATYVDPDEPEEAESDEA